MISKLHAAGVQHAHKEVGSPSRRPPWPGEWCARRAIPEGEVESGPIFIGPEFGTVQGRIWSRPRRAGDAGLTYGSPRASTTRARQRVQQLGPSRSKARMNADRNGRRTQPRQGNCSLSRRARHRDSPRSDGSLRARKGVDGLRSDDGDVRSADRGIAAGHRHRLQRRELIRRHEYSSGQNDPYGALRPHSRGNRPRRVGHANSAVSRPFPSPKMGESQSSDNHLVTR